MIMKKIVLGVFLSLLVLGLAGVTAAGKVMPLSGEPGKGAGAAGAEVQGVDDEWLANLVLNPFALQKIEFIHWKDGRVKTDRGKPVKLPSCYGFLTKSKVKWTVLPVSYVINPDNPQGLEPGFIGREVSSSAETWDGAVSKELMNDVYSTGNVQYRVQDSKNAIVFGDYATEGVIAVTTVWYRPITKQIVEFDILFDTDYRWGDALSTSTTDPFDPAAVMDLQNIAIHELGHALGLADVYQDACSLVTMYGYSDYEETQKRSLEAADIKGLQTLYGM